MDEASKQKVLSADTAQGEPEEAESSWSWEDLGGGHQGPPVNLSALDFGSQGLPAPPPQPGAELLFTVRLRWPRGWVPVLVVPYTLSLGNE